MCALAWGLEGSRKGPSVGGHCIASRHRSMDPGGGAEFGGGLRTGIVFGTGEATGERYGGVVVRPRKNTWQGDDTRPVKATFHHQHFSVGRRRRRRREGRLLDS